MAYTPGITKSIIYTVSSGATQQIDNGITLVVISSTSLLGTATLIFPQKPIDGQPLSIIAPKGITLLTLQLPTGQSLSGNAPIAAAANTVMRYKFAATNSTWYPN